MQLTDVFADILTSAPITKGRQSSHIQQWLGTTAVPQSLSIKIGTYLERLFNQLLGDYSILNELPLVRQNHVIYYDDEEHQVDILARIGDTIYHREMKANTDLDRGKKRDTLRREQAIVNALKDRYPGTVINSCVFCPFFTTSREVSGLGTVEGLAEFIYTFNLDITVQDFKDVGKSEQIHKLLLLK